jgi:acetylglutamate kinase
MTKHDPNISTQAGDQTAAKPVKDGPSQAPLLRSPESIRTAQTLCEALPFMQRYDKQIVVIKFGGNAMGGPLEDFARGVVLLKQAGVCPVVVHGGGPQIGTMLERFNIKSRFVDGLRVTDKSTMEVVEMVLSGSINKEIVAAIQQAGGRAIGISGRDGSLLQVSKVTRIKRNPETGRDEVFDYGFVGEPEKVDPRVVEAMIGTDIIPVIAPIGISAKGESYNVNADTAAGAIAGALRAKRLLLLTDISGVLDRRGQLIEKLTMAEARALMEDGSLSGGMIPKVETCIAAVQAGVEAVVILDGRVPHAVLLELYTEHGIGTLIE